MEDGNVESKGAIVVKGPGPENGLVDVIDELLKIAEKALADNLVDVVKNVAVNVKDKLHVPSVKLLVDLIARLKAMKRLPQEEHESFAAVLWKECQLLQEEERKSIRG